MKTMRVYWQLRGAHVHCDVFMGNQGRTLGRCGDLCMTEEEFEAWKNAAIVTDWFSIEFIQNGKAVA
jgi:hypothetical protein